MFVGALVCAAHCGSTAVTHSTFTAAACRSSPLPRHPPATNPTTARRSTAARRSARPTAAASAAAAATAWGAAARRCWAATPGWQHPRAGRRSLAAPAWRLQRQRELLCYAAGSKAAAACAACCAACSTPGTRSRQRSAADHTPRRLHIASCARPCSTTAAVRLQEELRQQGRLCFVKLMSISQVSGGFWEQVRARPLGGSP